MTGGVVAGTGVVTTGGEMPAAYGSPGVTTTPGVVAGGGTVVRRNGLVAGCELRQLANKQATKRTAQGRYIGTTPFEGGLASQAPGPGGLPCTEKPTGKAESFDR